ncbi:UDP-N-acetylmuramoyl-L-alanyl-D-glutamate synthetase [Catenovulum agarivorans DS-2]|uniref:UDP-N-acetylmuramoylalanine--D-glutamate ligase n=1 Tax=Catenovulum agarivorans DS-2 TaxID=1328313 RepID=W7QPS3_9ALTE|nr:UDP-N-acetylmuramoyl-L-alanine--D-glutamate ligase [Catenovulum agarivorans]EWH10982.1 UDP-N-acetylmuramoyl-L-alanyl-D-glutamate synthetase [Catenovulum agarivorans DS-2]
MSEYLIWGFGVEGKSAADYLVKQQQTFSLLTDNFDQTTDNYAKQNAIKYFYGEEGIQQAINQRFKYVIKSPGISLYRPEVQAFKQAGSKITSTTQMWFEAHPNAKTIVVTGTKGKSTTASLLHYLFNLFDVDNELAGNLGRAILEVTPVANSWTILELSSYQLADLHSQVDVFLLLNLFQEHVPWHQTAEQYYLDKTQLARDSLADVVVYNAQSNLSAQYLGLDELSHGVSKVAFADESGFYIKDDALYFKGEELTHNFRLKGQHNLKNLAACLAIVNSLKLDWRPVLTHLSGFTALEHRLQEVQGTNSVLYVNDSISTTPDSTLCALDCYKNQEINLILGGAERSQNYAELVAALDNYQLNKILLLGETGKRIYRQLPSNLACKAQYFDHMAVGMAWINQHAKAGQVVLLSPAAPSFGEFVNFAERGNLFLSFSR